MASKKHPGGRPPEYGPHITKKAREYLKECEDEEYEFHKTRGLRSDSFDERLRVKLPTIEGLAVYLKVSRDTLYTWEKEPDKQEFSDILAELRAVQADRLIRNGLSGHYNPVIAKVLLTKHGYREGIEQSGEGGGPMKVDITDQLNKTYGDDSTREVSTDGA